MIIRKVKNGGSFSSLVATCTMDSNPTGDLGWFKENMMVKDFETAIRKHKKGDLFTVDIPDKQWYYVCLKTYDDRVIKQLTILKVKNN
jgi:parvulin-like peptidyl-prolyl isomerase